MSSKSTQTLEAWQSMDHAAPGATLRRVLESQRMSQRDLARRTGLTAKHVNQLLAGTVPLSAEVAERLSLVTGVPAALQLLAYFGVASPAAWREMWLGPNAALRQSTAFVATMGPWQPGFVKARTRPEH